MFCLLAWQEKERKREMGGKTRKCVIKQLIQKNEHRKIASKAIFYQCH